LLDILTSLHSSVIEPVAPILLSVLIDSSLETKLGVLGGYGLLFAIFGFWPFMKSVGDVKEDNELNEDIENRGINKPLLNGNSSINTDVEELEPRARKSCPGLRDAVNYIGSGISYLTRCLHWSSVPAANDPATTNDASLKNVPVLGS